MRNDELVEKEPCSMLLRQHKGQQLQDYRWQSGSKTILIRKGRRISVNGARARTPRTIGEFTCILNSKTKNQFCHSG